MTRVTSLSLLLALLATSAFADGDPAAGKRVFAKCKACHAVEEGKHKMGPSLFGVADREAGAAEGYRYSKALAGSGLTWNDDELASFLGDPKGHVPGTKMSFAGIKNSKEIADIIAYIRTVK